MSEKGSVSSENSFLTFSCSYLNERERLIVTFIRHHSSHFVFLALPYGTLWSRTMEQDVTLPPMMLLVECPSLAVREPLQQKNKQENGNTRDEGAFTPYISPDLLFFLLLHSYKTPYVLNMNCTETAQTKTVSRTKIKKKI